jgi:signal transduction histidine kinase
LVSSTVLAVALGLIAAALLGVLVRTRRSMRALASVLSHAEVQRRAALHRAATARRNERALIAADVHDDSIQVVTAALLQLRKLEQNLEEPIDRALATIVSEALSRAIARLRRLVFDLDLEVDDNTPLATACASLVHEVNDGLGIRFDIDAIDLGTEPSDAARSLLLRNVRECLTNAVRHGEPTTVSVRIRSVNGGTEVAVADDGHGFDVRSAVPAGHLGLRSMRSRMERAGGRFAIDSAGGQGATVVSWLPSELDLRAMHEPGAHGGGDGLETRVGAELHEQVLNVVANRVEAEEESLGDRLTR